MTKNEFKSKLNNLGKSKTPFLFIVDFNLENFVVNIDLKKIKYKIDLKQNFKNKIIHKKITFNKFPISFNEYKKGFEKIIKSIQNGDTYLLNFTQPTKIETNLSLEEIFYNSNSKFKVYVEDKFVSFSPERFIEINNNKISTYPMKGTIDKSIENAKSKILNNKKEMAEHTMVVDLLRNDLNIVTKKIFVERFRYIDEIKTKDKILLQVSSKVSGFLEENWQSRVGDLLLDLLPAGSITGTPKKKTVDIIKEVEKYDRGFFSGVCGVFDGESLDSFVLIRYIEENDGIKTYKSGGGITIDSDVESEYDELMDKVYLAF